MQLTELDSTRLEEQVARLEALVVDSLVRGEVDEALQSWASALNWSAETM